LLFEGKTVFGFNDLDDSGYCRAGLDPLRYFTALRLYTDDKVLIDNLLDQYVATVFDNNRAAAVPSEILPNWSKQSTKSLAKQTSGDRLILDADSMRAPSESERAAIVTASAQHPILSKWKILDIASLTREQGGSGGLKRYHLLVLQPSGRRTIIEFKQAATPATEFGNPSRILGPNERLMVLKSIFWNTTTQTDYFFLTVEGTRLLVRDKLAMKNLNLKTLTQVQLQQVLLAEASFIAQIDRPFFVKFTAEDLRNWLAKSSEHLETRWRTLFQSTSL
jgi:hypothetical protein